MYRILLLIYLTCALGFPSQENVVETEPTLETAAVVMKKDCANGILSPTCLKIAAITLLEKIGRKRELTLFPGVSLVKDRDDMNADAVAAELARLLPEEPEARLNKFLFYNLETFLDTHSVRMKLTDESSMTQARNLVEEGRARKKGRGAMATIFAMAVMLKGTLMSIGLGGLAMLAGKALMTAMMSLLLSAIIGIKSLSSGQKSTTYEIVSKPVYTHSHSHSTAHEDVGGYGHSGYGRNLNVRRR